MGQMNRDRVILVNSSNRVFGEVMPLGLMAVATRLRQHDLDCSIIDLPCEDQNRLEQQIEQAWRNVELKKVLFVGFSTMCNTLPRSLSLARELRKLAPAIPIVFGGPEASLIARKLVETFEFIDAVVVGEAEEVLLDLLEALRMGQRRNKPGLWFGDPLPPRAPGIGESIAPGTAPQPDIETLEPIDYHTYPPAISSRHAAIEVGRGCPYDCSYCSTKEFFGGNFRLKNTDQLLREVTHLVRNEGVSRLDFVHDMFTFDRKRVVEICQALRQSGLRVQWSCSARPDRVDSELLRLLFQAGCVDIFFGLETGSQRLQSLINKRLKIEESLSILKVAHDLGMKVTVAFIIGFPQENEDDLTATLTTALRLRFWRSHKMSVQVHLLSPLTGTRLAAEFAGQILYDGHNPTLTSVNCLTTWEEAQVRTRPDLFSSFYYFKNPIISRSTYKWLHAAFSMGWADNHLHDLQSRYHEKAGAVLLDWARQKGPYPIESVYQHRWTAMRRQQVY